MSGADEEEDEASVDGMNSDVSLIGIRIDHGGDRLIGHGRAGPIPTAVPFKYLIDDGANNKTTNSQSQLTQTNTEARQCDAGC